jgi:hypothetical protein
MKQLGARPIAGGLPVEMFHVTAKGKRDAAGTCLENFPADLRIQQFPVIGSVATSDEGQDDIPFEALSAMMKWLQCFGEDDSALSHLAQEAIFSITSLIRSLVEMADNVGPTE